MAFRRHSGGHPGGAPGVQYILDSFVFQIQIRRPCWFVLAVLLGVAVAPPGADRVGEMSADDETLRRDAIAAITRGDHITALSRFQESLSAAASTRRWRTRLQLAQVLGALGHHSEALGEYKRVIKRVTLEDVGAAQSRGTDNDAPGNRSPSTSDHEMTQLLAAIKVAAASEAREAGRGKEAERLMEDAAHLHPAWRHRSLEERDCSARGLLAQGSDLYWSHYLYAQCVGDSNIHAHIKALEEATRLKPDWAVAYNEMGLRFGYWQETGRLDASAALLSHAVQLDPTSGIFATNLAMAYHHLGHLRTAADVAQRAAQLLPANAAVQEQLGRALEDTEHLKGALFAYTAAAELEPSRHDALCAQVFLSHYLCAWKGLKDKLRRLEHILRGPVLQRNGWGGTCDQPFRLFSYSLPPDVVFLLTAHVTAKEAANIPAQHMLQHTMSLYKLHKLSNGLRGRLTVAYMSSDFGNHAVAGLIGGLFRKHDRIAFELVALALKTAGDMHQEKVKTEEWREGFRHVFTEWVDLSGFSDDREASLRIQKARVHILVDLNGLSKGGRAGILLRRPAPVSVTFLGYPGTSGGSVDNIVTDRYAAPPELRGLLVEGQLLMPHSYFVNDYRHLYPRPLPPAADDHGQVACGRRRCFTHAQASRQVQEQQEEEAEEGEASTEAGNAGAILANFGQMYKIQPELLMRWCRSLRHVGSGGEGAKVSLWLLRFPKDAAPMMAAHFAKLKCGGKEQLVLSDLLPMHRHLSVKGLATLALDTLNFNGHTTASDTLWAGVPIVSLPGDRMAARAGASMAMALGEATWLVRSLDDYDDLVRRYIRAFGLRRKGSAGARQRMLAARRRLEEKLLTCRLFDTDAWAREWHRALRLLWDLHAATPAASAVIPASASLARHRPHILVAA